jgi:hypothetical protein
MATMTAEQLAQRFHEHYERLAPEHGYKTRRASAVPWDDVPEPNRSLMVAVAAAVLHDLEQPKRYDSLDALRAATS